MNHVLNDNVTCFTQKHPVQHFYQLDSLCFAQAEVSQCRNGIHTSYGFPY